MFVSPSRILLWIVCVCTPAGAIYSSLGSGHINVFTLSGSASMRPMMLFLLSRVSDSNISSTVASTGSNTGLKQLMAGRSDFALVSHDVDLALQEPENKAKWKERKLKTITLAREALFLVYKPPEGCTQDLILSKSNVEDVYSVFSGHKKSDESEPKRDLKDWITGTPQECSAQIRPWVKSSGPLKSGTSKTFVNNPLLDSLGEDKKAWVKKVREGYGTSEDLYFAHESNLLHWSSFSQGLKPGFATYFPSSFYFRNKSHMDYYGLKTAKIQYDENGQSFGIDDFKDVDDKKSNYKWGRTLNLIFSIEDISKNESQKNFINLLLQQLQSLSLIRFTSVNGSQPTAIDSNPQSDCETSKFGEKFSVDNSNSNLTCS